MTNTMRPLKITPENTDAIEAALKSINGKATQHTFCHYFEIETQAARAEKWLEKMSLPKGERPGAVMRIMSGDALPNAYKYAANTTTITLTRRGAGWYLTDVTATQRYGGGGSGHQRMTLTPEQDAKIIEIVRREYTIARPVVDVVAVAA